MQQLLRQERVGVRRLDSTDSGWMSNSGLTLSSLKGQETSFESAILDGLQCDFKQAGWLTDFEARGPTVEEESPEETCKETYHDEISGTTLNSEDVREARRLEVEYVHKLRVYREATKEEVEADGCKPLPTR